MSKHKGGKFPKHDTLLSVKISSTSSSEVLKKVESCLKNNVQVFISTPNPEIVLMAQNDPKLLKALNMADIAIPDGSGLLWAANKKKLAINLRRIPGRELMEDIFELSNRKKYKIFLLGASEKVNTKAQAKLVKQFPKIKCKGSAKIRVDAAGKGRDSEAIKMINEYKPHILFVAFGAPKQEKWVAENIKKLDAGVIMVVGGSLDYYAGAVAKVPKIISRMGFEWLFRLMTQPSRLPRIFNAVVKFPLLVYRSNN